MVPRLLVLTDNERVRLALDDYFTGDGAALADVSFASSTPMPGCPVIRVKSEVSELDDRFDLILSAHCKQRFPAELVERVRCVNLHPGFNPETRGWYPQVWAILNGLKIGFTLHIMDAELDHGAILYREEVEALFSDTSKSLYERVLDAELASIPKWMPALLDNRLPACPPEREGRYHSRADFAALCDIDLDERGTFRDFYNRLRATSFAPFDNAFVTEDGERFYVRIEIRRA